MNELNLLKRITDIRDDLIEDAFLPNAVPVAPVRPRGLFWGVAAKVVAACTVGVISLGLFLGLGLPAYREWREQMTMDEMEQETPAESASETEPPVTVDFEVEVTPTVVRAGESVTVTVKATFSEPLELVPRYRIYFTYGTIPVDEEILSYAPSEEDPFTVAIPINAPVGEYDLTVSCEGFEQEKTFEKLLTVTEREGITENPYVWITCNGITVYPYQHYNGVRKVYYEKDYKEWSWDAWYYAYGDGIPYNLMGFPDIHEKPTVVYREGMTLHYAESVYSERYVYLFDEELQDIKYFKFKAEELDETLSCLDGGIYYFIIAGSHYGEDHYEKILALSKAADEDWKGLVEENYFQNLIIQEYEKDPDVYKDLWYCGHVVRVIIP